MIDNAMALRILVMLVKPFIQTDAFRLGIIDAHGRNIIPVSQLTSQQKSAYSPLHRLVFNLKKIINKLPGGENRLRNLAGAMFLFKEAHAQNEISISAPLLEKVLTRLDQGAIFVQEELLVEEFMQLNEEVPVNSSVGSGGATGGTIGLFSQGGGTAEGGIAAPDLPISRPKKRMQKFVVPTELYRRFSGGKSSARPWSDYLNSDNDGERAILDFARKNPKGIVVLQNGEEQKAIRFNRTGGGGRRRR